MLSSTPRTQIKKGAHKAVYEQAALHQIIDESLIAHIAIADKLSPNQQGAIVIPMLAWRVDEYVYIHGANNSRLLRGLREGVSTCLTFTLFDGWVLARSAFHHSAHYRSAVVLGEFTEITDNQEKDRLLNHFLEQIAPGRTEEVRRPLRRRQAHADRHTESAEGRAHDYALFRALAQKHADDPDSTPLAQTVIQTAERRSNPHLLELLALHQWQSGRITEAATLLDQASTAYPDPADQERVKRYRQQIQP